MAAKANPRRIPRTQRDVDAAYDAGISAGLNRGIELMLYVLIDKRGAPMDDVQQLARELNHAAECVAEGYITWPDIRQMLKEYDVEVELT
nr:MAG TPA: Beta-amylase [Caudoviricetes sp.]